MSLLDHSPGFEPCIVYPEETVTDIDGNIRIRPSTSGIATVARFQDTAQTGTSSRLQEQDNEGFESEEVYTMRLPRSFNTVLGMASQVEWHGSRWAVFGHAARYNSSARTSHITYTIKRY